MPGVAFFIKGVSPFFAFYEVRLFDVFKMGSNANCAGSPPPRAGKNSPFLKFFRISGGFKNFGEGEGPPDD